MNVRVRMAPSPTGNPHVGLVRTALFNWAFARHNGGSFVLRIEDTDVARNTEESERDILDLFRWLGLDWDEGPDVGGEYGPYRQSERTELYRDALARLSEAGYTYSCFCTAEEVKARREASGSKLRGYDGQCRDLPTDDFVAFTAAGKPAVTRFRMPLGRVEFDDLVRGHVEFDTATVPDPVLAKADGSVLYTLANPVDDALMHITHIFRGEDLLPSTPRQIPLFEALVAVGVGSVVPQYGHLPYVTGEGNRKLSKSDEAANALGYRRDGFVPEGMLNYLALLGWGLSGDRDVFTLDEMVEAFRIEDVNASPSQFDLRKAEAINAQHIRLLGPADFADRLTARLAEDGVLDSSDADAVALAHKLAPLVQTRMNVLGEAEALLANFFHDEDSFTLHMEETDRKFTEAESMDALAAARDAVADLPDWRADAIEAALRSKLVEELGLKPRKAFGPVRFATSGHRISPPLFESLELLGRDEALRRMDAALALRS